MISFDSVHQSIKAEKVLAQRGIVAYAFPTPREIDISCGQCLLFEASWQTVILQLFAAEKVRWTKLFSRIPSRKAAIYEKITEYGGTCGTTVDT
ncbi:DUF3343 domain-containing protein [Sporomusa acidovorans]|uniref:Putative Se/S carrier protein-like domain-containing protein n=1 Tax=Sporomusa acidovorans (strain ATCC 49682 / DSM 3132 / Mol) TaxID=1123286 RepID=A0ABZ3JBQ5_SPOA4|nr:DUF3343 domain-containing protein [Sporomusa acidovorans]OZC22690.1 hypothetical protein SPACI_12330 [Sporomusa acidovorans DSM 3132]SDE78479.1 Protein of unknown function [Sporomusa acidovorans]